MPGLVLKTKVAVGCDFASSVAVVLKPMASVDWDYTCFVAAMIAVEALGVAGEPAVLVTSVDSRPAVGLVYRNYAAVVELGIEIVVQYTIVEEPGVVADIGIEEQLWFVASLQTLGYFELDSNSAASVSQLSTPDNRRPPVAVAGTASLSGPASALCGFAAAVIAAAVAEEH